MTDFVISLNLNCFTKNNSLIKQNSLCRSEIQNIINMDDQDTTYQKLNGLRAITKPVFKESILYKIIKSFNVLFTKLKF